LLSECAEHNPAHDCHFRGRRCALVKDGNEIAALIPCITMPSNGDSKLTLDYF